jgi:hypothetical protein
VATLTTAGTIDIVLDQNTGSLLADGGPEPRIAGFHLLPAAEELLEEATQLHVPMRLVLPEPLEDPAIAQLRTMLPLVEDVVGLQSLDLPGGAGPNVVVAADRVVRGELAAAGWSPVPHPALALPTLLGRRLQFAWIAGDLSILRRGAGFVPYWLESGEGRSDWAFGLLSRPALARALDAGLELHRLPLRHEVEDSLLVQLDDGVRAGDALAGHNVLWAQGSRVLLAIDAATTTDEIPAHGAHGHFRLLTPSPELLRPARIVTAAVTTLSTTALQLAQAQAPAPAPVTPDSFAADVARYAGGAPLNGGDPVRSRHTSHPDNARVVGALVDELRSIGLAPVTHEFAFGGRILRNVIADVPGRRDSLVIVGCHLDSTAARDPGFTPGSDPARGADDDASGMAALLALARHLPTLGTPHHTVRLCFFNAEEAGLVGSRAYAASLKAGGAEIAAVVCCDMIGFNSDGVRTWEVHAGFTNPAVRDLSAPLADVVARAAGRFAVLAPAQVYTGTSPSGGSDPALVDGAINRSDHASFHEQGYPAILVSEDFFPNRPGDPAADPNPNYHSDGDAAVDADYAADIVRAVSVAVIELAAG